MFRDSLRVHFKSGLWCFCMFFLTGALYPTSMRINEQGRLVVNFRTKAHFRGLFVESHSGGQAGEITEQTLLLLT